MKDILTKIGESITTTVKEMGEQTQKSLDQTVYRTELMTMKSELKKLYQELGEAHYEAFTRGEEADVQDVLYNQITHLLNEINKKEDFIKDIINTQKDSFDTYKRGVRTTWNENMSGTQRPEKGPDGVEVMKICDKCNTGNHVEAAYCIYCGSKF